MSSATCCSACGLSLTAGLDPREWLTVAEFARERRVDIERVRSWIRRRDLAGIVWLSERTIRINGYRWKWVESVPTTPAAPQQVDPRPRGVKVALPCPACAAPYDLDRSLIPTVTSAAVAKYLKLKPGAFKKRRHRGLPPSPRPSTGRSIFYDPASVQRTFRLAMLARELR